MCVSGCVCKHQENSCSFRRKGRSKNWQTATNRAPPLPAAGSVLGGMQRASANRRAVALPGCFFCCWCGCSQQRDMNLELLRARGERVDEGESAMICALPTAEMRKCVNAVARVRCCCPLRPSADLLPMQRRSEQEAKRGNEPLRVGGWGRACVRGRGRVRLVLLLLVVLRGRNAACCVRRSDDASPVKINPFFFLFSSLPPPVVRGLLSLPGFVLGVEIEAPKKSVVSPGPFSRRDCRVAGRLVPFLTRD